MTTEEAGPDAIRRRVVVHGRVHGVGFRAGCARRATAAGLGGWVRNRADGSVEAVFEGPGGVVDALVSWCRAGPPMARVTALEVTDEPMAHEAPFTIR